MWTGLTEFQCGMLASLGGEAFPQAVTVTAGEAGITLTRTAAGWSVSLEQEAQLGRALSLLRLHQGEELGFTLHEAPRYDRLGVMLDVARNGVMKPEALERFLTRLCLMGCNTVQLYMEDVFEVPGYPYFGYGRGRYTKQELKDMDAAARRLGIELVPALQTLAHLGQALKWPAMRPLVDVGDILLIDDDKTYDLIEAMFTTIAECFTSRRVNIGMDEAHMLGLGRYLDKNGFTDRTSLMQRHFARVHDIASAHGFAPMLWSDMFFRLASGGDYYAPDAKISPDIAKSIPADTSLIYWDYYSDSEAAYDRMLDKHGELSPNTIFAGGAWKWSGFSPCNAFSMHLADLAHPACVRHGVKEVVITMWGDNGAECSAFAVLPALCAWAEKCYAGGTEGMAAMFRSVMGCALADYLTLDAPVFTPDNPAPGRLAVNPTKTLLYEDVLTPLFSHQLDTAAYAEHFADCRAALAKAAAETGEWALLFQTDAALCDVLEQKCRVQAHLRRAWAEKDREALGRLCWEELPALHTAAETFARVYRRRWLWENKPAGLDIFDLRMGGLIQRVDAAAERIEEYLAGHITTVEELDEPLLPFDPAETAAGHKDCEAFFWHRLVSPISIAMI